MTIKSQSISAQSVLKLHSTLTWGNFRSFIDSFAREELTGHSINFAIDPLQFDPHLAHFCTACKSPSKTDLRRSILLSPFSLFFKANPKTHTAWLTALIPEAKSVQESEYNRRMRKEGWRFGFAMAFWDNSRLQALIAFRRTAEQGDFTESERRILEEFLYPHLEVTLNRLFILEKERSKRIALERLSIAVDSPILLMDWDLRLMHSGRSARDLCAQWVNGASDGSLINSSQEFQLPDEIRGACLKIKHEYERANQEDCLYPYAKTVHRFTPNNEQLSARITRMPMGRGYKGKPVLRIALDLLAPNTEKEKSDADRIRANAIELSHTEVEVTLLVCEGLTNQEIACQLKKSPSTVKKQLQSIFQKMNVNSRTRLISKVTCSYPNPTAGLVGPM